MELMDLKMSRQDFLAGEKIYDFVKENLHTTKDVVDFFAGDWTKAIPTGDTPREHYSAIVKFFFDAFEAKDPILSKILTPANVEKMLSGIGADDIGLSSSGFVYTYMDSYGVEYTKNLLVLDFPDFAKVNHKDKYDKRFYDFVVKLTSDQLVNLKVAPSFIGMKLTGKFVADCIKESDFRSKDRLNKGGLGNGFVMIELFLEEAVSAFNGSDKDFYKYCDRELLSKEAYGSGWTGNYSQLISYKSISNALYSMISTDPEDLASTIKVLKHMSKNFLHADIFVGKTEDANLCFFRDLAVSEILHRTKSSSDTDEWDKAQEVLSFLDKEFSYLASNPSSIKKFSKDLKNLVVPDGVELLSDRVNDVVNFFDVNALEKVLKNEAPHPIVSSKILNHSLNKVMGSVEENSNSSSSAFKL